MSVEQKLDVVIELLTKTLGNANNVSCSYTVAFWCDEWLETYKKGKIKPLTYEKYAGINKNYIKPLFGTMMIDKIDIVLLQQIFNNIQHPRTREHVLAQLNEMFDKAVNMHLISYNPFKNIELPRHKKKESVALTREQEIAFLDACKKDKYGDLFQCYLFLGLRRGEGLALTRGDIDFENKTVSISKTFNKGIVRQNTKTEAGTRIIPLFDNALFILEKYKNSDKNQRLFKLNEANAYRHFKRILEFANLDGLNITIHSLRHTFATRCYENAVDVKTAAKWLGHTDISLTLKIYTHCNPDYEQEQVIKVNRRYNDTYNQ